MSDPIKLSEIMATINKPAGRARLQAVLDAQPFPHFRQLPGSRRIFKRIEEDGSYSIGEIVAREWRVLSPAEIARIEQQEAANIGA